MPERWRSVGGQAGCPAMMRSIAFHACGGCEHQCVHTMKQALTYKQLCCHGMLALKEIRAQLGAVQKGPFEKSHPVVSRRFTILLTSFDISIEE